MTRLLRYIGHARIEAFAVCALIGFVSQTEGAPLTKCTIVQICYCTNSDLAQQIADKVSLIRTEVRRQRSQGKSTGYISIPLSSVSGSYFDLNVDIANNVQSALENRFGAALVWLLNPADKRWSLPSNATGQDYIYMWTQVLAGDEGLGADFDFVYFTGPSDFATELGVKGVSDLEAVEQYYDKRVATNDVGVVTHQKLSSIDKRAFRNYYGLKASVAYSFGSHDEWNIAKAVNERRRLESRTTGIADQLAILFDGRGAAPALFEAPVQPGDAGQCTP